MRTKLPALPILIVQTAILSPALTRAQNIFVSDFANNRILEVDSNGQASLFASSGLNGPSGILFDPAGNLFVANTGGNTIKKFSPAGADLGTVVTAGVSEPARMVLYGEDGTGGYEILVANIGNNTVGEFDSIETNQTAVAYANSSLQSPSSIILDAPDILVANYSDGTIQKFQLGDANGPLRSTPATTGRIWAPLFRVTARPTTSMTRPALKQRSFID